MLTRKLPASILFRRCLSQRINPEEKYEFVPATQSHLGEVVDLCINHFIYAEPHSVALGFTPKDARPLFEYIIGKSLLYPYSYVIYDKATSQPAGFRVMSIGHRDHTLEKEPFDLDPSTLAKNAQQLIIHLDKLKTTFWQVVDEDVHKVLRREITFIKKEHQRQGIAQYLLHKGVGDEVLKSVGVQGIVSEASSVANQTLLHKNGYKMLTNLKTENCADGTDSIKLYFRDLRHL